MKHPNESKRPLHPHEQRVVDECIELNQRRVKLDKFIVTNPIFLTLPKEEKGRLQAQRSAILLYKYILEQRIAAFCEIA
jgi:hypothetical protein